MEVILNVGLGIGLLMFFILLFKKGKQQGDYLFLAWILIMLAQVYFYFITIYHFEIQGIIAILSFALPLLGSPLLFLYILCLTGHKVSWKIIIFHLSVYVIYVCLIFILQQDNSVLLIAKNGYLKLEGTTTFWLRYYAVPLAISGLVYCIWDLRLLEKHRKSIANLYSFNERINLNWVSYIVYSFLALFLIASAWVFGATQFQLISLPNAFALVGISLCLMLSAFGFYGFRQTTVFSNINILDFEDSTINNTESEKSTYLKSGLTWDKIQSLAQEIEVYMVKEKPFLNDNLNLTTFAKQLRISPSNLSQVINQYFEKSFYDYINQYRIEKAKTMFCSNNYSHLSILGIAYDCGFKSKSSFNRYFRKYTGKSPSSFKKNSI
ncbi:helix-turn-helix domain-containing protein [uncultured Maribacter sp.]|uniref:helix-turn-helix domain-containing protein n=1 Tax=uncultured Maribacter sp. TaxID=431308 RepID=UPI0030EBC0A4|tara:strand:- start:50618 stop:51757 length:1140 start_codon:yes stop_codon:yes gene_type:complete